MRFLIKSLLCLLAVSCCLAEDAANEIDTPVAPKTTQNEDRGRLIVDLFKNYDKRNYPSNVVVKFGVALIKLDVNERKSVLETDIWTRQIWTDPRLTWNPEEYGNETVLRLPVGLVWRPDITLYNDASHGDAVQCKETNVLVYSTGQVLWVPPCHLHSHCNLTLDTAPWSEQTCELKFGSWTMDGFMVDLKFYKDEEKADVSDLVDISDWELTGNTAERKVTYYSCCKEPYVTLSNHLSFKRKSNRVSRRT